MCMANQTLSGKSRTWSSKGDGEDSARQDLQSAGTGPETELAFNNH